MHKILSFYSQTCTFYCEIYKIHLILTINIFQCMQCLQTTLKIKFSKSVQSEIMNTLFNDPSILHFVLIIPVLSFFNFWSEFPVVVCRHNWPSAKIIIPARKLFRWVSENWNCIFIWKGTAFRADDPFVSEIKFASCHRSCWREQSVCWLRYFCSSLRHNSLRWKWIISNNSGRYFNMNFVEILWIFSYFFSLFYRIVERIAYSGRVCI